MKNNKTHNRTQWLFENSIPLFMIALKKHEDLNLDPHRVFKIILQADPSGNKSAAQWIIQSYINQGYLWEDIVAGQDSKVWDTLKLFSKYKNRLPIEQRNIYGYETLADLYISIQNYHQIELDQSENLKGNELKRLEKQIALDSTCVLLDEPDLKIVIPLTEEAAKWWGKGTRWCTAANKHNFFDDYNKQAPLFVILFQDHRGKQRRLQLWVIEDDFQFMDETDKAVTTEFVQLNYKNLQTIIEYACSKDSLVLEHIPEIFRTEKLCEQAIEKNERAIKFVPEKYLNYEILKQTVRKNGRMLKYAPDRFKTQELCRIACENSGLALKHVPDSLLNKELCRIAVKGTGNGLYHVPTQFIDLDLCKIAVEKFGVMLERVPDRFKTQELCLIACKQHGYALQAVPEDLKTPELCQVAVEKYGLALQWVPKELITQELCWASINQGEALKWVPIKFKTKELCVAALKQSVYAFFHFGREFIDQAVCQTVCQTADRAIRWVPQEFRTKELCEVACIEYGKSLAYVPDELKTQELCQLAVQQTGLALQFAPVEFRTQELCRLAVENDIFALNYVPNQFKTLEWIEEYKQSNRPDWNIEQVKKDFDGLLIQEERKIKIT